MSEITTYLESEGVKVFDKTNSATVNVDCTECGYKYQTIQTVALVPYRMRCTECGSMRTKTYWFKQNET